MGTAYGEEGMNLSVMEDAMNYVLELVFQEEEEKHPTDSRADTDPRKGILEPRRRVLLGNNSFSQDREERPAGLVLRSVRVSPGSLIYNTALHDGTPSHVPLNQK